MADFNYFNEDSIKQIIALIKTEDKKKLELSIVNALPALANAKEKTLYLVNLNKVNSAGKKVYNAYIYNGVEYLSFGEIGNNIQVDTLTAPTANDSGKVVQYIGTTNANYIHGYFYECIENNGTYEWANIAIQPTVGGSSSQVAVMPAASIDESGKIVQYIGPTTNDYVHGYFYECVNNNNEYTWTVVNVGASVESITREELTRMWEN